MFSSLALLGSLMAAFAMVQRAETVPEIFDAGNETDMMILRGWFDLTNTTMDQIPDTDSVSMLEKESCLKNGSMCEAFMKAKQRPDLCLSNLLKSECMVVYMYSMKLFYKQYAEDIRSGQYKKYEIFDALLLRAQSKISLARPLPPRSHLFKGSRRRYNISYKGDAFYFRQFCSTSYNKSTAQDQYGRATLLIFEGPLVLAGNISGLTEVEENEVLVSPFEAFQVVHSNKSFIRLKSSAFQEFLRGGSRDIHSSIPPSSLLCFLGVASLTIRRS